MEFVQPIRDRKKIDAIKKNLRNSNLRDHCLFVLGINSGLRVSDLLALTVGDVIDANGRVVERISIREEKTAKAKNFPLGDTARQAIADYTASRGKCDADSPLFASRKKGGALQRAQAWKIINDAAREVGLMVEIGTHTLRKTFAYHAYKTGKDIAMIQKLLNHASPSATLRYIGITQDEMDDVYLTMNL